MCRCCLIHLKNSSICYDNTRTNRRDPDGESGEGHLHQEAVGRKRHTCTPNSDSGSDNYATISASGCTGQGSLTYGASSTWTCTSNDPATSVTFTNKEASGNWRLQKVIVTFAK